VIQEAAHEDANIIFGAVVDPGLTGRVKITVIATGFDRKAAMRGHQTPVDLSSYTQHIGRAAEAIAQPAASAGAGHAVAGAGQYAAPSLAVNRRTPLDLSSVSMTAAGSPVAPVAEPVGFDSPLDVPAFLRRQG
jgi:cell division protein FtsZ